MRHFFYESAESRCVRPLHHLIELLQPQTTHNDFVLFRCADDAANQFDFDLAFHNRFPFQPYSAFAGSGLGASFGIETSRPRISRTSLMSRSCSSALMVAFTTLCGLWLPIDFVSTFGIPQACTTARTGPPAITPVPSRAGFSITRPAPYLPST